MKCNIYKKTNNLTRLKCLVVLTVGIYLSGCVKNDDLYSPNEGTIYMPQAYQDKSIMTLYKMDEAQTITFGAYYAGFNAPGSDISIKFEIDSSLVEQYNTINSYLGYSYYLFPDSVYSISGYSTVIKAGEKSSDPLTINVLGKKIQFGYKYMLPIRMVSTSEGKMDSTLSITYFKLDTLLTRVYDLTSQATLTVSDENKYGSTASEGSPKLVDGSVDTKFLSFSYSANFWMQLSFSEAVLIDAYDMTSANDASERDPKTWELVGSNDGTTWVSLDVRTSELFADRLLTRRFNISSPGSYKYYRLKVTENGGATLFQQAEWRLLQYY
ncbi:MAG: DUF1735 domain-containing protein [Niabella sp.]